jgi:hypothetical protein
MWGISQLSGILGAKFMLYFFLHQFIESVSQSKFIKFGLALVVFRLRLKGIINITLSSLPSS